MAQASIKLPLNILGVTEKSVKELIILEQEHMTSRGGQREDAKKIT